MELSKLQTLNSNPQPLEMFDVIVFGSATRDVFLKSKQMRIIKDPRFITGAAECFSLGSKIELDELVFTTGGGGSNAAISLTKQGFKTALVARVGMDLGGKAIIEELYQEKSSAKFIQQDQKIPTSYSFILLSPGGERTILVYRGASKNIDSREIDFEALKHTKWFHFCGSFSGDFKLLEKIFKIAKANNIKIAINPGALELKFGTKRLKPLFENVDILMMNDEEAADFFEENINNEKEILEKARDYIRGIFIMTKGPKGVVVCDRDNYYRAGIPRSKIIDRTGAGDAFNSGFVSAILDGKDIEHAIQFGTANATSVIQYFGAKRGLLKKYDWGSWKRVKVSILSKF